MNDKEQASRLRNLDAASPEPRNPSPLTAHKPSLSRRRFLQTAAFTSAAAVVPASTVKRARRPPILAPPPMLRRRNCRIQSSKTSPESTALRLRLSRSRNVPWDQLDFRCRSWEWVDIIWAPLAFKKMSTTWSPKHSTMESTSSTTRGNITRVSARNLSVRR